MRRTYAGLALWGLILTSGYMGYQIAQAERRGFCTGHWNEAAQTCRPYSWLPHF